MKKTENNKLRDDLAPGEKAEALKIGWVGFSSNRKRFRSHGDVRKFIPSREQH
jgi:hypothetical protein